MVGVDFSIWSVVCFERGAFGKGCSGHCRGRCLPRLDGNRRGGRGADFNFCVQGAGVILEDIFPYDAHCLGGGAQKRGMRCKLRKLLACYPKTFHIFALNKYI